MDAGAALVLNTTEGPRSLLYELAATKIIHNCFVCLQEILEFLVSRGGEIDFLGPSGLTALQMVVLDGDSALKVLTLLASGADINALSEDGRTALIFAAMQQNSWFVPFLVREGADVNIIDSKNKSAFSYAVDSHNEIAKDLSKEKK